MWGGEYIAYDRDALYEEVWAEPVRTVARRYGVSGVYLAKICRKLSVPLPPRGYWAKIRAGKSPRRTRLLKLKKNQPDKLVVFRREPTPARVLDLPADAKLDPPAHISVAGELTDPHKLVARTKRHLENAKPEDGLVRGRPLGLLNVSVSPASLDRALRIADALLKGMEAAGLKLEITGPSEERRDAWGRTTIVVEGHLTRVYLEEEWICFAIMETVTRTEDPKPELPKRRESWGDTYTPWQPTTYTYTPTGKLALRITSVSGLGVRTSWADGKRQHLEDCVEPFVANLGVVAEAIKADRDERERQARQWAEERRREEEKRERRRAEKERLERVIGEADAWHRSDELRAYAWEGLRRLEFSDASSSEDAQRREDLERLLDHANRLDPLTANET